MSLKPWTNGSSIFAVRHEGSEMMDDLSIVDDRLERALRELPVVNRWLGGYDASWRALIPLLRERGRPVRLLDLGAGIGDSAAMMVERGARRGLDVEVVAADVNPETVAIGRRYLRERLGDRARHVRFVQADAMALPFDAGAFDISHGALFLHHFSDEDAPTVLREMNRVSRRGIVINDLHRHPLAYVFVRMLGLMPFFGEMFRHDGPISVLRGFRRNDLTSLFRQAGMEAHIRWHPGFRWIATTRGADDA